MRKIAVFIIVGFFYGCSHHTSIDEINYNHLNPWWKEFKDPLMDELAQTLLKDNLTFKQAIERKKKFHALADAAHSSLFPMTSLGIGGGRGNDSFGQRKAASYVSGGLNVGWDIDLFGAKKDSMDAANAQAIKAHASTQDILQSLLCDLFSSIIHWRTSHLMMGHYAKLVSLQEEKISLMYKKFDHGLISHDALNSELAELEILKQSLWEKKSSKKAYAYQIETLVGKKPDELKDILEQEVSNMTALIEKNILINTYINPILKRPDIRAHYAQVLSLESTLKNQEKSVLPSLSFGAFFGAGSASSGVVMASNPLWSLGADLTMPLFTFGLKENLIRSARHEAQEAVYAYQNAILQALKEVYTFAENYMNSQEILSHLKTRKTHLNGKLLLVKERFEKGLIDKIPVLEVSKTLESASIDINHIYEKLCLLYINFQKALGATF